MKQAILTALKYGAAVAAVFWGMGVLPAAARTLTCEVSPAHVPITVSYHGARLTIAGKSAADDDLVVKISTKPADSTMKYKGKAAGLFWMKKGSVEFKGVPAVYLVHTTADLQGILADEERQQYQLGYDAMAKVARIEDGKGQPVERKWFDEFIRFKEKEMVYGIHQGTISRRPGEGGNTFEIVVNWPYQALPGVYNVEAFAVNGGRVVDTAATTFEVERVGMTATLSKMAVDQAVLYGIMAVVIAMAAGFAVGAIFKKGGGSH